MAAVQKELLLRGCFALVTPCGCLGACFDGPSAVVYPDGIWYGGLAVEDARALADHLATGTVHVAKQIDPPGHDG
jgi:(2Fe-2S) ferredoxin